MEGIEIRAAESAADIAQVRELWREYWESFGLPMDFQGFGKEMDGLPGVYGAAGGVLLLAATDKEAAGSIALRRLVIPDLKAASGEVKRLYLRAQFRGQGLARRLLDSIIERARLFGYESLYADTLPVMTDALRLYQRTGFERVEAYSPDPTPGAIYMKMNLIKGHQATPAQLP